MPDVVEVTDTPVTPAVNSDKFAKLKFMMMQPTSMSDLRYLLNDKVNVVKYSDLDNYKSIDEVLGPYMCSCILYPGPPDLTDVGHWCALFCNSGVGNRLEFFDSYGCYIDQKIELYNDDVDNIDTMHPPTKIEPKLLELIINSRFADNMHYNDTPYQSEDVATAVCGLWCVMRIKNKHLNDNGFRKLFYDLPVSHRIPPDLLVTTIVCNLFPELLKA